MCEHIMSRSLNCILPNIKLNTLIHIMENSIVSYHLFGHLFCVKFSTLTKIFLLLSGWSLILCLMESEATRILECTLGRLHVSIIGLVLSIRINCMVSSSFKNISRIGMHWNTTRQCTLETYFYTNKKFLKIYQSGNLLIYLFVCVFKMYF
jgi:hypothetical protein